jgi:hypothetical protein
MPFALILIGLLMVVSGARDTYKELGAELTDDFTGPNNFTYWVLAFGSVGALGYVPQLRNFSRTFMALMIIAMLLANQRGQGGGFFESFMSAIQSGPEGAQNNQSAGFTLGDLLSPNIRF